MFSWFGTLGMAFIPGGQIGLLIKGIGKAIITFIGWVIEDFTDLLAKPKRLAFAIVVAGLGAWFSAHWYKDQINDLKADVAKVTEALEVEMATNVAWKARYDDETKRAAEAEKARDEAAESIRHAAMQAAAEDAARKRAAAARRLRTDASAEPKAGSAEPAKSGLFSLQNLPWASK